MENAKHKVRHEIKIRGNEKFHVILLSVGDEIETKTLKGIMAW